MKKFIYAGIISLLLAGLVAACGDTTPTPATNPVAPPVNSVMAAATIESSATTTVAAPSAPTTETTAPAGTATSPAAVAEPITVIPATTAVPPTTTLPATTTASPATTLPVITAGPPTTAVPATTAVPVPKATEKIQAITASATPAPPKPTAPPPATATQAAPPRTTTVAAPPRTTVAALPRTTTVATTTTIQATSAPRPLLLSGFFNNQGAEPVAGKAVLGRTADGKTILRLENLKSANGPDLYVYLVRSGSPASSGAIMSGLEVGKLRATQGNLNYELSGSLDVSQFKSVAVYCKAFSVIFGYANLAG